MRLRAALTTTITLAVLAGGLTAAHADSAGTDFEGFTTGDVNGQQGWTKTGPFDVAIADPNSFGISAMGSRALRVSNAITSGSFGDQTFSFEVDDEAGESSAQGDGVSGPRQTSFAASFDVRTTTTAEQPGLFTSISPDRGDGARMSYLGLADQADGVHVQFYDYQSGALSPFMFTDVATLDRSSTHTLTLAMHFQDGPGNDVVQVFVDGALVHTGTSWEDYFRDEEGNPTRTVDSLLFRVGGAAASATAGNGYLFDDVTLTSGGAGVPCAFDDDPIAKTLDLLADCTTDETVRVPQGYTLDGNGYTITAVDPAGGHFLGAVVQNEGTHASVHNLGVTADVATACDGGTNALAGIRLAGASGSVTDNEIQGLEQGASGDGCQEGNAIDVTNDGPTRTEVTVTGNDISDYQKTGIRANGNVAAEITGNSVAGYGPVDFIAQNGVQVSRTATAVVEDNAVFGNFYTPESYVSCGVLLFDADGVRVRKNQYAGNERDFCNFGRGGGSFQGA